MATAMYPLFGDFFQFGYVTNDIERAIATFRETAGIQQFKLMRDMAPGQPMNTHIALAYAGNLMIELIEPLGAFPMYTDLLPSSGEFVVRHHHMGYRVADERRWRQLQAAVAQLGLNVSAGGEIPDLLSYAYIDTRHLYGHYQEYIFTTAAGESAFFGDVPRF